MIEEPPVLTIARETPRPKPRQLEAFRGVPTSFVCDAQGGIAALDWRIKPVVGGPQLLGVALTCDCGPGEIMPLAAAIARCQPGDVIVAATGGHTGCAVVGDIMLGMAKNRKAAGLVTDGLVRDTVDLAGLDIPVFARGVSPNSPHNRGPGSVGLPVVCGGRTIATGDIVLADGDGVVTVPYTRIGEVLKTLEAVKAAEAELVARVRAGLTEVPGMGELLAGSKVRWV
mgnify:CR=1 FL=1